MNSAVKCDFLRYGDLNWRYKTFYMLDGPYCRALVQVSLIAFVLLEFVPRPIRDYLDGLLIWFFTLHSIVQISLIENPTHFRKIQIGVFASILLFWVRLTMLCALSSSLVE